MGNETRKGMGMIMEMKGMGERIKEGRDDCYEKGKRERVCRKKSTDRGSDK